MRRVILKTIVSGEYELPYVLLNLLELDSICDEFWITEANRTITGEEKVFNFLPFFEKYVQGRFPKAKFIPIDISHDVKVWNDSNSSDEDLRWNEFLIRSRFIDFVKLPGNRDIVISVDGDEVIYNSIFLRMILFLLKLWPFREPIAFLLTLRQFMFYLNLYMSEYEFYSPTIAHFQFYLRQNAPQWRGGGRRIKRPLGGHFSWVMTPEEMQYKILNYGHRDRLKHLANLATLKSIKSGNYGLLEPNRKFGPTQIKSHRHKNLPKSLWNVKLFIKRDVILGNERFWLK